MVTAEAGEKALVGEGEGAGAGGLKRVSTRVWVQDIKYDSQKLFNKVL